MSLHPLAVRSAAVTALAREFLTPRLPSALAGPPYGDEQERARDYWEALIARGLLPESFTPNPDRLFPSFHPNTNGAYAQFLKVCADAEKCVSYPQVPRTVALVEAFASADPALLQRIEQLAKDATGRTVVRWRDAPVTRIAWGFGAAPTATAPPIVPFLAPALACALSPYLPPGAPLWTAEGLSDPSVREVLEATWDLYLPTHANPFPVLTALDALRYGFSFWGFSDGAALVLVRPVASLFP